jgi:serralysin
VATSPSNTVTTPITRTAPGSIMIQLSGIGAPNESLNIQADGKVLVGGYSSYVDEGYVGGPGEYPYSIALEHSVIRLNADGTLDTHYGTGGVDIFDPANGDKVPYDSDYGPEARVAVQADGKVLSAYSSRDGLTVERYNGDGSLDTRFGQGGVLTLDVPHVYDGYGLTINADGTFYVTARSETQATVTKVSASGTLIDGFGNHGELSISSSETYYSGDVSSHVLPDGGVLLGSTLYVGGYTNPDSGVTIAGDPLYSLERFKADGSVDTRFGDNGVLHFDKALGLNYFSAVTVQADGKILVVGDSSNFRVPNIIRLNADGSFDESFGNHGIAGFSVLPNGSNTATAVTVQADGKILVAGQSTDRGVTGASIIRLNADGSIDTTFGSQDGKAHLDGYAGNDNLLGTGSAEIIYGQAGDDVLQGNGGRDILLGGAGADIFRFTQVNDSYRTATQNASDLIQDFDATQDRIDLIGLGFTGIGDGRHGTLAIQANVEGTRTYLKSFEADASGHRFELALDGNLVEQLNTSNLVFTPPTIEGTAGRDVLTGSALAEILVGGASNDRIDGGAGNDVLIGGSGADWLTGGEGKDVFRYTSTDDSYRTANQSFVDLIDRFEQRQDSIDISALGYTGFGDGTHGTLKLAYDRQNDRTYLKDLDANAQGHRFEIALNGYWLDDLDKGEVVFAQPQVTLVGVAQDVEQQHLAG